MTDLVLLAGMFGIGLLMVRWLAVDLPGTMRFALAFPLGAGSLTFLQLLLSWAGTPISTFWTLATIIILIAVFLFLGRYESRARSSSNGKTRLEPSQREPYRPLRIAAYVLIALMFSVAAWFSLSRSVSSWDAMAIWGAKGYGIADQGTVFAAREWGALGLAYPLNIPLLVANFRQASGDLLPASKILSPLFFAALLLFCVEYWRRQKVDGRFILLGSLLVASCPVLFEQATIGYVNLPFSTYLLAGAILSIDGLQYNRPGHQMLGSISFGMAAWTRAEGILYVLACYAGIFLVIGLRTRVKPAILSWIGPLLVLAVPWFIFSFHFGSPADSHMAAAIQSALEGFRHRTYNLHEVFQIGRYFVRHLLEPTEWGFVIPGLGIALLLRWRKPWPAERSAAGAIGLCAGLTLTVVFVMYYLASFRTIPTLVDFLYMAFNRSLLPFVVFLILYGIDVIGTVRNSEPSI
jgi:hypothetical protein